MAETQTAAEKAAADKAAAERAEKAAEEDRERQEQERQEREAREAAEAADAKGVRFSRDRLLGPDGYEITGHPTAVIAGALHNDPGEKFTRAQIAKKIEAYLEREDESKTAEQEKQEQADEEASS